MTHLDSEENIFDFVAKLPKESLFMTYSRKSICPSKIDDANPEVVKKNSPQPTNQKGRECSSQPLMDLSNHKTRTISSSNADTQDTLNRTFERNLNIEDSTTTKPAVGSLHSSSEFKLPTPQKSSWKAPRRSSTAGTSSHLPCRESNVGTLKENGTQRQSPFLASQSRHGVWSKTTLAIPSVPFALPPSRIKDPIAGSVFEKIKSKRHSVGIGSWTRKTSTLAFPKPHLKTLSVRSKKNDAFSSVKKMGPLGKGFNQFGVRNPLSGTSIGMSRGKAQKNEQECRRALQFQEIVEERDEDATQPLPLANLAILEQTNENGSVMHGHRNEDQTKTLETAKVTKENTFLIDPSSDRPHHFKRPTRNFGIPVLNRKTRSHVPCVVKDHSKDTKGSKADVSTGSKVINVPSHRVVKNHGRRLPRRIPDIKIKPPSLSNTIDSEPESLNPSPGNHSLVLEDATFCKAIEASTTKTSPSAPPNSPSRKSWDGNYQRNNDNVAATEPEKPSQKDSSTNTILSSAHFDVPFSQVEGLIKSVFLRQQTILNNYEMLFHETKIELARKSELLMKEFDATFQPLETLRNTIVEIVGPNHSSLEVEENVELKKAKEVTIRKKSHSGLKFLDSPLPLKNKKRITRSFSHPPSPDTFLQRPSCSTSESFHSAESLCFSPFTNLVGDCNRDSVLPVTPMTRRNFSDVKASLNDQLHSLYD